MLCPCPPITASRRFVLFCARYCFYATLMVLSGAALARQAGPSDTTPHFLPQKTPGALVLYSGLQSEIGRNFASVKGGPAPWRILADGSLLSQETGILTRHGFRDCQLHLEFKVPAAPNAQGPLPGASGVFMHGRFRVEINDSFGKEPPDKTDCGAIFNMQAPLVNACRPRNEWQSVDILFRAPRLNADESAWSEKPRITVMLNGVLVQKDVEILAKTGLAAFGNPREPCPIGLGYFNSPVQFRNIWVIPRVFASLESSIVAAPQDNRAVAVPEGGDAGQPAENWQDIAQGQQIPVEQASFGQGGFQIQTGIGPMIRVPFVNQNLYAMKFGLSTTGWSYFINEGGVPVLYLARGGYLINRVTRAARWYPFTRGFLYRSPIYIGLAPNWNAYLAMGWYPGMVIYGGLWRYGLNVPFTLMPGYYTEIGGVVFPKYYLYHNYYTTHPGYYVIRGGPRRYPSIVQRPPVHIAPRPPSRNAPPTPIIPRRQVGRPTGPMAPNYQHAVRPILPLHRPRRPIQP